MKTIIYSLCLLFTASILFTSCRDREEDEPCINNEPYISTSLDGVVINGVRWATRNVDAPGTFAASPQSTGMFFQWNRPTGWAATGNVTGWDNSAPIGTYWTRANDPCPPGWRVPTKQEFISLSEATTGFVFDSKEWNNYLIRYSSRHWVENWRNTGVNGMILGVAPNLIFLPAAGERNWRDGALRFAGVDVSYWSSTTESDIDRLLFVFSMGLGMVIGSEASTGMPIRCVAEN